MKVSQTKKAFVPVTITLETEEEVKLLSEVANVVDIDTMEKIDYDEMYLNNNDIDDFATELYDELYDLIN